MTDCDALLAGIVADPLEETRWLILADWLEEHDDPRRAELLRLHRRMLATCCEPDAHPDRAVWQARMVELLIAGVRPCVPQETLILPGGVPMTFSFIPPGAFLMGSEKGEYDEKPVHRVEVSRGFFMGAYPVTQAQWKAVMGTDPSVFKGAVRPVESVFWGDCQECCEKLRELTGRRVELPTEVEWEYACRAGTTTEYHFGNVINTDLANYDGSYDSPKGEYREETTDVDSFPTNAWGLFDMHGNVWEWCANGYGPYPKRGKQRKIEKSPSKSHATSHVLRGGCCKLIPKSCRAACRRWNSPNSHNFFYGFRVCLRLD